jgi:hypothetical protein
MSLGPSISVDDGKPYWACRTTTPNVISSTPTACKVTDSDAETLLAKLELKRHADDETELPDDLIDELLGSMTVLGRPPVAS